MNSKRLAVFTASMQWANAVGLPFFMEIKNVEFKDGESACYYYYSSCDYAMGKASPDSVLSFFKIYGVEVA